MLQIREKMAIEIGITMAIAISIRYN